MINDYFTQEELFPNYVTYKIHEHGKLSEMLFIRKYWFPQF